MAELWFLKIDGIQGESTDAHHQGEIDVLSWSWGVSRPEGGGLSDVMVGTVDHSDGEVDAPAEQFSLTYLKVEVTYRPQTPTGKMGQPVTFAHDLGKNTKL